MTKQRLLLFTYVYLKAPPWEEFVQYFPIEPEFPICFIHPFSCQWYRNWFLRRRARRRVEMGPKPWAPRSRENCFVQPEVPRHDGI